MIIFALDVCSSGLCFDGCANTVFKFNGCANIVFVNIRRAARSSATSVRTRARAQHPYVHVRGGRGRDCANMSCCARLSFIDLLCEYIVHCMLTAVLTKCLNINGCANVFCCARAQHPYAHVRGGRGVCEIVVHRFVVSQIVSTLHLQGLHSQWPAL